MQIVYFYKLVFSYNTLNPDSSFLACNMNYHTFLVYIVCFILQQGENLLDIIRPIRQNFIKKILNPVIILYKDHFDQIFASQQYVCILVTKYFRHELTFRSIFLNFMKIHTCDTTKVFNVVYNTSAISKTFFNKQALWTFCKEIFYHLYSSPISVSQYISS